MWANALEIKITFIAVFVLFGVIGTAFGASSGINDKPPQLEEWMEAHTLLVNSTTSIKYEQEYLLINETYSGDALKERFGIEYFAKELRIPVDEKSSAEGKVLVLREGEEKKIVTEKLTIMTTAEDPPRWWENYTYPQWMWLESGGIYEKNLPINLAWINTTKDVVKSEILEEGWITIEWPFQYDEYVYDPIGGWIKGDGVADDLTGLSGRYHALLWQLSDGNVVANAHHDDPWPHEADQLEEAEELVAGYFNESGDSEWNVYEDSYDLDNVVASPYSNGLCTETLENRPPTVIITCPINGSIIGMSKIAVRGYATDDKGVVGMSYAHAWEGGGRRGGGAINLSTNFSFNWTVSLEEGANTITVTAIDAANKSGNFSIVIIRDTTTPEVTITAPLNGSIITASNVTVTGYATDDIGIVEISCSVIFEGGGGGRHVWLVNAGTNIPFNQTVSLREGLNTITITAIDKAGNSDNASVIVNCNYKKEASANLSIDYEKRDITIKGKCTASDMIDVAIIGPDGFTEEPLCFANGFVFFNSSVDTNNSWEINFPFPECIKEGCYIAAIYSTGIDGVYGISEYEEGELMNYLLSEYSIAALVNSTQEVLLDILDELTVASAGSDDLVGVLPFNLTLYTEVFFDTGSSANPYPSIAGWHNGTITPLYDIVNITTLYTYPCPGTGGHTKYVKIWNSSWEGAEAYWGGYNGDWHNITFNNSFTLYANETYNYTIRTGSYPQIIHNRTLLTDNGWINCTEFTDANGRTYDNWIPAIKLWSD
jgi:hypothetical protein